MANLTAAREDNRQDGVLQLAHLKAGVKVYKGGLVGVDATGYAKPAAGADKRVIGIAFESGDNTNGADGAVVVRIWKVGVFELNSAGLTAANVGDKVYVTDDNTVKLFDAAAGATNLLVGVISEVVSATKARVAITPNV
jgi:predicted RecA/RadA family phage recombinase